MRTYRPESVARSEALTELRRAENPQAELEQRLAFEMQASPAAFAAELLQLRRLLDAARREKRRLPPKVAAAVTACDKARLCRMAADIDQGDAAAEAALASLR